MITHLSISKRFKAGESLYQLAMSIHDQRWPQFPAFSWAEHYVENAIRQVINFDQATAEVVALKAEIDSMSTSLIAKDKIISDVTFSNAILHWQVDRLTGERDSLLGAHDALLSDLAAMQSKRDALADTVRRIAGERDGLRTALEHAPIGTPGETHGDIVARYYRWYGTVRQQALRGTRQA